MTTEDDHTTHHSHPTTSAGPSCVQCFAVMYDCPSPPALSASLSHPARKVRDQAKPSTGPPTPRGSRVAEHSSPVVQAISRWEIKVPDATGGPTCSSSDDVCTVQHRTAQSSPVLCGINHPSPCRDGRGEEVINQLTRRESCLERRSLSFISLLSPSNLACLARLGLWSC